MIMEGVGSFETVPVTRPGTAGNFQELGFALRLLKNGNFHHFLNMDQPPTIFWSGAG